MNQITVRLGSSTLGVTQFLRSHLDDPHYIVSIDEMVVARYERDGEHWKSVPVSDPEPLNAIAHRLRDCNLNPYELVEVVELAHETLTKMPKTARLPAPF